MYPIIVSKEKPEVASTKSSCSHTFLDSEATKHGLQRPWQSYWPPEKDGILWQWLVTEYPQVLAWKFDPRYPFDRPWQQWTKQLPKSQQPSLVNLNGCERPRTVQTIAPSDATPVGPVLIDKGAGIELSLPQIEPKHFNYLAPLPRYNTEKPYHTRLPFLKDFPRTNIFEQAYPVTVSDINGFEDHFKLETAGFQYIRNPVPIDHWTPETVTSIYLPMIESWMKEYFQCRKFRCKEGKRDGIQWTNPFTRAHCDITSNSSVSRLHLHLPEEAEAIKKGRYRYIDVWRPINGTEQDHTLALCDARTLSDADLVPTDILFPHFCDELYELKYNPRHRWYYKKGMSSDDTVVFKLFDSEEGEVKFCAHSAFKDHTVSPGTPPRESIEVRAIVIG